MAHKRNGSRTRQQNLIPSEVKQRTDRCPVEQAVSEQLIELRGILKDVTPVYFSGYPPAGGGDYHHISSCINGDSSLIREARLLAFALAGRFADGHQCFESKALRQELYSFCDILRECSDPDNTKSLDRFEKELNQLVDYFKRVRETLRNGEAVDDLNYCNEVTGRITSLIDILRNEICESFITRESEIRRAPGRSYRRPERSKDNDRFTDKDRAMLKEQVINTRTALYFTSNREFGDDPTSGPLITQIRHRMAEDGLEIIKANDNVSCQEAADTIIALWRGRTGAYTSSDSDREALRQAIQRLWNAFKRKNDQTYAA